MKKKEKIWKFLERKGETVWCKKDYAKDKNGEYVSVGSKKAVAWCSLGLIQKVYGIRKSGNLQCKIEEEFLPHIWSISRWNDSKSRKFSDVVKLFKKADL